MMPAVRVLATVALSAVILVAGLWPADAAPPTGRVVIQTLPKVPKFPITLDDETVFTDSSGKAQFETRDRQSLTDRVTYNTQKMELDGRKVRVEASRLYGASGQPVIAMNIFWPVRFSFVDVNGAPVDVSRIESVELKSTTGETRQAAATDAVWLQGSRVVTLNGPQNKEIQWTVQAVEYASSNVVNSAQQRFEPAKTQRVEIELLFFRSRVTVRDAFFGFGVGDAVLLTAPDGRVDRFPLGENSAVDLPSLPRGDYSIVVDGPGPRMPRPVAISRDQILDLKFYSWLDIGIVVAVLATFAIGTLSVGWWRRRRARKSVVEDDSEWQLYAEHEDWESTVRLPATLASMDQLPRRSGQKVRLQRQGLRQPERHIDRSAPESR
ncbi:MAG TPA: hypothetical protein VF086_15120 [Propionibacteriaceae bacterium]